MLTEMDKLVLVAFAESGMNKTETAKRAFRSRVNIYQCLERVKKKTGLDPYNVFQLAELLGLVKVRHGEWMEFRDGFACVDCGECANYQHNYCPYCGAKMDGKCGADNGV